MGLDISAYKNLKVVENPKLDEDGDLVNWDIEWTPGESMEWSEKNWPGRGEGLEHDKVYTFEDEFSFRAGSYSGYNWFRKELKHFAKASGKEEDFQELINFADNEGVIGPVVSKKLAEDFADNYNDAKEYADSLNDGDYWFSSYENWKQAFEVASINGAVNFR